MEEKKMIVAKKNDKSNKGSGYLPMHPYDENLTSM